jgi:hypothetical protein
VGRFAGLDTPCEHEEVPMAKKKATKKRTKPGTQDTRRSSLVLFFNTEDFEYQPHAVTRSVQRAVNAFITVMNGSHDYGLHEFNVRDEFVNGFIR